MLTPLAVVMKLNQSLQAVHQASYEVALENRWAKEVAVERPGQGVDDFIQFLVEDIRIREGLGIEYSDLRIAGTAISHKPAGGGFEIRDRDFVSGGAIQMKTDASSGLGAAAALYGQNALLKLINSLTTTTKAYDGISFCGTGHFVNYKDNTQGVFTNVTTGCDFSDAAIAKTIAAGAAKIESRVMADGNTRMVKPTKLMHRPQNKFQAYTATAASFISMTDNIMAKKSTYDITPVSVPGFLQVGGKDAMLLVAELVGGGMLSLPFGISTLFPPTLTNYDGLTVPELARVKKLEFDCTADMSAYVGHPYLVELLIST